MSTIQYDGSIDKPTPHSRRGSITVSSRRGSMTKNGTSSRRGSVAVSSMKIDEVGADLVQSEAQLRGKVLSEVVVPLTVDLPDGTASLATKIRRASAEEVVEASITTEAEEHGKVLMQAFVKVQADQLNSISDGTGYKDVIISDHYRPDIRGARNIGMYADKTNKIITKERNKEDKEVIRGDTELGEEGQEDPEAAKERAKKRGTVLEEAYIPINTVGSGTVHKSGQGSNYHVDQRTIGKASTNSVLTKGNQNVIYKERNYENGETPDVAVKIHSEKQKDEAAVYKDVETKTITKERNVIPHGLNEETGVYTADNFKSDVRPFNPNNVTERDDRPYNKADGFTIVKNISKPEDAGEVVSAITVSQMTDKVVKKEIDEKHISDHYQPDERTIGEAGDSIKKATTSAIHKDKNQPEKTNMKTFGRSRSKVQDNDNSILHRTESDISSHNDVAIDNLESRKQSTSDAKAAKQLNEALSAGSGSIAA